MHAKGQTSQIHFWIIWMLTERLNNAANGMCSLNVWNMKCRLHRIITRRKMDNFFGFYWNCFLTYLLEFLVFSPNPTLKLVEVIFFFCFLYCWFAVLLVRFLNVKFTKTPNWQTENATETQKYRWIKHTIFKKLRTQFSRFSLFENQNSNEWICKKKSSDKRRTQWEEIVMQLK